MVKNKIIYSGVMTNYSCTAKCEHCMYCSAPNIKKSYVTAENAEKIASDLRKYNVDSVHIGGGEPFINFPGLCRMIECLRNNNVGIDYIETNAFWCKNETTIRERVQILKNLGVDTLMASVDPFHIEFIPLEPPLMLCRILSEMGMNYFIWQEKFLRRLIKLDHGRTYSKSELKNILGENYITNTAGEYGLGINGRALRIARIMYPLRSFENLLDSHGCSDLFSGVHCHVDLYGNVVPSGCTGIAVSLDDFVKGGSENLNNPGFAEKYPVLSRLYSGGTDSLYRYAKQLGFIPDKNGYCTKCEFCYDMRSFLESKCPSKDIAPPEFYSAMRDSLGF